LVNVVTDQVDARYMHEDCLYNCLHYSTFSLFETQHFNTKLPSTT